MNAEEKYPFEVLAEEFCSRVDAMRDNDPEWHDPIVSCLYTVCSNRPDTFADPLMMSKLDEATNALA